MCFVWSGRAPPRHYTTVIARLLLPLLLRLVVAPLVSPSPRAARLDLPCAAVLFEGLYVIACTYIHTYRAYATCALSVAHCRVKARFSYDFFGRGRGVATYSLAFSGGETRALCWEPIEEYASCFNLCMYMIDMAILFGLQQ